MINKIEITKTGNGYIVDLNPMNANDPNGIATAIDTIKDLRVFNRPTDLYEWIGKSFSISKKNETDK